jgi:hypothetical protein
MKKNIALVSILLAAIAQTAFANGVEKVLPADAANVALKSAKLAEVATSSTTHYVGNEVYDTNNYTTVLEVTVTYQSKDDQDVSQRIEGESDISYDATPTVVMDLPVTDAEIAAIKAKKLDARTLVTVSVAQENVQINKPGYQYQCSYGNDSNEPINGCVEPAVPTITVSRPVLSIDRN